MLAPQPPSNREILNKLLWELNVVNIEAAELCGVSERTVYRWLSGDTKVPDSVIKLLQLTLVLRKAQARV